MVYHVSVYHLPHVSICVLGIFTTLTKTVSHISIYFPYFTPATHCRDRPFPRWRAKLYTCLSPQFGLQHVINTHIGIYKPNKNLEMQVLPSQKQHFTSTNIISYHTYHILSHLSQHQSTAEARRTVSASSDRRFASRDALRDPSTCWKWWRGDEWGDECSTRMVTWVIICVYHTYIIYVIIHI